VALPEKRLLSYKHCYNVIPSEAKNFRWMVDTRRT